MRTKFPVSSIFIVYLHIWNWFTFKSLFQRTSYFPRMNLKSLSLLLKESIKEIQILNCKPSRQQNILII